MRSQSWCIPSTLEGISGSKTAPFDEPLAYLLSAKTGRPVKMVMDQTEELGAGNPKHAAVMRVKTGVKRDGVLTAHLQEMYFDSGAYAGLMPLGALAGVDRIAANWRIPNARFDQYHVYTNNVPGGYMRGPGEAQGSFAIESHMDEIARALGMDPLEFRMKNVLREGQRTPMNEIFADVRAEETLRAAVERSGYGRPEALDGRQGHRHVRTACGRGRVLRRGDSQRRRFSGGQDADLRTGDGGVYDVCAGRGRGARHGCTRRWTCKCGIPMPFPSIRALRAAVRRAWPSLRYTRQRRQRWANCCGRQRRRRAGLSPG